MPEFLTNFVPQRCDVVYGLDAPRNKYLDKYVEYQGTLWDTDSELKIDYPRRDEYLDFIARSVERNKVNYLNEPITSLDFLKIDQVQFKASLVKNPKYLESLQESRYKVEKVGAATMNSLTKGDQKLAALNISQLTDNQLRDLRGYLAIGRACKFALDYFVTHPSHRFFVESTATEASGEPKVHYALDELTSRTVAGKQAFNTLIGGQGVPITTSELRYLFRNWHLFKKAHDKKRLVFYRNLDVAKPLWEDDPSEWIPYAKHRLSKFGSIPKEVIGQFEDAAKTGNSVKALEVFFSIRTCEPSSGLLDKT